MAFNFIFLTFFLLFNFIQAEYAPIVELADGKVKGIVQEVYDEMGIDVQKVNTYMGIRYGRAERFALPKPVEPWADTYNATHYRFSCPAHGVPYSETVKLAPGFSTIVSNEDCLFVNVFQPAANRSTPRDVMVWFHGGGFTGGSIFELYYNGRFIATLGDVIVVTVNYRLDAFGFLYAGTPDSPGNMGLHDQVLALKWVQANIAKFGGDPAKVTIFGQSAGSWSVGTHVVSSLSKGMFHRAIMQSGSPGSWLGSQPASRGLEITKIFAQHLNCHSEDQNEVLKCLRSKTAPEILTASKAALQNGESFILCYGGEGNTLLPLSPPQALKEGKYNNDIDLMYGNTNDEGGGYVYGIFPMDQLNPDKDAADFTVAGAKTFITFMMNIFSDKHPAEVADYYEKYMALTDSSPKDTLRHACANVFGDFQLVCPTTLFAEEFSRHAVPGHKFWAYRFTRRPMQDENTYLMGCKGWQGVCHGHDVIFTFGMPLYFRGTMFSEEDVQMSRDVIHAWTTFAKTGSPGKVGGTEWEPAFSTGTDDHKTRYLQLDYKNYTMVGNKYTEVCDTFWRPRLFI